MRKVIISVAPVAGSEPLIAETLALDVQKCVEKGASMCHLHCKTREGVLTPKIENFIESFEEILKCTDVVAQASTGGLSNMTIEERCNPLEYPKIESASLNGGSTNLGEEIYKNSFHDIRYCANVCYKKHIIPEVEVFDIGMIHNIQLVTQEAFFLTPLIFNMVFGHKGGMQATIESLYAFKSFLPQGCLWGVTHFGRDNWEFLAAAIAMGATIVRIGFEDSKYIGDQQVATYNWQLVDKVATIITSMDLQVATVAEARKILNIRS